MSQLEGAILSAQPLTITHLAGSAGGPGWFDGIGNAARFSRPLGIAADGEGNLYVADCWNHTIRRIAVATGAVTTLAGTAEHFGSADGTGGAARFYGPAGIAFDGAGSLYVCDEGNSTIRKIVIATGGVTTVAGSPGVLGRADGIGSADRFYQPDGVASDGAGNLYVADTYNCTIRKIVLGTGMVTTLAGKAGDFFSGCSEIDGIGSAARFGVPRAIAYDAGNLFVGGHGDIRKVVIATAAVTTIEPEYAGELAGPLGVLADGAGSLYLSDTNAIKRMVIATGAVTTIAGLPGDYAPVGSDDGVGMAARFYLPWGITTDRAGSLYVADSKNFTIRKVEIASAAVTTLAGAATKEGSDDGVGSAARFRTPGGVATDGAGHLFVADADNYTIRKIDVASGAVTTFVGRAGIGGFVDGIGSDARLMLPWGIVADGAGNLYVSDMCTIRKVVIATGEVSTLAGSGWTWGSADGIGSAAQFHHPGGMALDGAGNLYVADSGNSTIRKIVLATAAVTTIAGAAREFGAVDGVGSAARFWSPSDLAPDGAGKLYVADTGNSTIRQLDLSTSAVTTLAGTARVEGAADGIGSAARFYAPNGIAADGFGNLHVADWGNRTLRKIVIASGTVTTEAGSALRWGTADGTGPVARFLIPVSVACDGAGNLFISDMEANAIRMSLPTLPDTATIDMATAPVGARRQLDTSPSTATSWHWDLVTAPSSSISTLSSDSVRDPTFVPDVPGLYVFRLRATDGTATSVTTTSLNAFASPTATVTGSAEICPGQSARIEALVTGQSPWSVEWADGVTQSGQTVSPVERDVSPATNTVFAVRTVSDANSAGRGEGHAAVKIRDDRTAPAVTAPAPIAVVQSLCCGAFGGATGQSSPNLAAFLAGGTATDDCTAVPMRLAPQVAGADADAATCFASGVTQVTFRFADGAGNIGTATSPVTVQMYGDLNEDGAVDPSDMVILRAYFNFAVMPGNPPWTAWTLVGDLNHDRVIDPTDLVLLRAYFNLAVACLAP